VLCDFDGTLAAIVEDPAGARPMPGAVELLRRLAARYGVTAVISGRPLAFLSEQFAATSDATFAAATAADGQHEIFLVGLYGLERLAADGSTVVLADAERWRPAVDQVADAAERDLPATVEVERKGLSVTLHVRRHPEQAATAEAWAKKQARAKGLAVLAGRFSWELRPPVAADKGTIVEELAVGLDAVCFVGDDLGDVPAFAALDRLRASGVHAVKVAVRSREAPAAILDAADIVVDGPAGALAWLRALDVADKHD
jgi:trehalose 6-phosphate phosphatase